MAIRIKTTKALNPNIGKTRRGFKSGATDCICTGDCGPTCDPTSGGCGSTEECGPTCGSTCSPTCMGKNTGRDVGSVVNKLQKTFKVGDRIKK